MAGEEAAREVVRLGRAADRARGRAEAYLEFLSLVASEAAVALEGALKAAAAFREAAGDDRPE